MHFSAVLFHQVGHDSRTTAAQVETIFSNESGIGNQEAPVGEEIKGKDDTNKQSNEYEGLRRSTSLYGIVWHWHGISMKRLKGKAQIPRGRRRPIWDRAKWPKHETANMAISNHGTTVKSEADLWFRLISNSIRFDSIQFNSIIIKVTAAG